MDSIQTFMRQGRINLATVTQIPSKGNAKDLCLDPLKPDTQPSIRVGWIEIFFCWLFSAIITQPHNLNTNLGGSWSRRTRKRDYSYCDYVLCTTSFIRLFNEPKKAS